MNYEWSRYHRNIRYFFSLYVYHDQDITILDSVLIVFNYLYSRFCNTVEWLNFIYLGFHIPSMN